jgi:hypothetical protein
MKQILVIRRPARSSAKQSAPRVQFAAARELRDDCIAVADTLQRPLIEQREKLVRELRPVCAPIDAEIERIRRNIGELRGKLVDGVSMASRGIVVVLLPQTIRGLIADAEKRLRKLEEQRDALRQPLAVLEADIAALDEEKRRVMARFYLQVFGAKDLRCPKREIVKVPEGRAYTSP